MSRQSSRAQKARDKLAKGFELNYVSYSGPFVPELFRITLLDRVERCLECFRDGREKGGGKKAPKRHRAVGDSLTVDFGVDVSPRSIMRET